MGARAPEPRRIVIAPSGRLWRMEILGDGGEVLDYTLSSSRWHVWRMATMSWRLLMRRSRKAGGDGGDAGDNE